MHHCCRKHPLPAASNTPKPAAKCDTFDTEAHDACICIASVTHLHDTSSACMRAMNDAPVSCRVLARGLLQLQTWLRRPPDACYKSHVTRHTSHVTRHKSHVTRHTSHVTRHTSHVTCHTSHVTRHTSHVTHLQHSSGKVGPFFTLKVVICNWQGTARCVMCGV